MHKQTGPAFFFFNLRQLERAEGKKSGFASGEKSGKQDEGEEKKGSG
jgi:hypothetical protein